MEEDSILFINIDEAKKICENCKKSNKKCKKLRNKSKLLQKLAITKKIYLISEFEKLILSQLKVSKIYINYDNECMKNCRYNFNNLKKPLENYNLWTYCSYPRA